MLNDFYRGQAWRTLRKRLMLERVKTDGILYCEFCNKPIIASHNCIGHHVIPLTTENVNDWNIALNPTNIQLVHSTCHNIIHEKLGLLQQKVYIVYGAPCAGKTTYVDINKGANDLIFDIDSIYSAISGAPRYDKSSALKPIVFAIRETVYNAIQYRQGEWRNAWIIGTFPFNIDRELLAQRLGAEIILIKANYETCIERLNNDKQRESVQALWKSYIDNWFEDYQQGNDDEVIEAQTINNIIF